mgnify:CR=1 FL=1
MIAGRVRARLEKEVVTNTMRSLRPPQFVRHNVKSLKTFLREILCVQRIHLTNTNTKDNVSGVLDIIRIYCTSCAQVSLA